MSHSISQGHNEARLEGSRGWLDSGPAAARLRIYGAPQPDPGDAPGAAPLLAEIGLAKPCGTVAANVLSLVTAAPSTLVTSSGTAAWARLVNGNGDWSDDLSVSTVGGGAEVELSTLTLFAGGSVVLASAVLS